MATHQNNLYYLERKPKINMDKPPLLILLHGYGSNEQDLFSFAEQLPGALHIVSVRAVYTLQEGSYAWYGIDFEAPEGKFYNIPQAKKSLQILEDFIETLKENLNIDKEKIFLMGFSQGAILSYALALNTAKITYVMALSGYLEEDLLCMKTSTKIKSDFFISHGTQDPVIPYDWAKKAPAFLNDLHIKNSFHSYPAQHGICPDNFLALQKWIIERI